MTASQLDLLEQRLAEVRRADEEEARNKLSGAMRSFNDLSRLNERLAASETK